MPPARLARSSRRADRPSSRPSRPRCRPSLEPCWQHWAQDRRSAWKERLEKTSTGQVFQALTLGALRVRTPGVAPALHSSTVAFLQPARATSFFKQPPSAMASTHSTACTIKKLRRKYLQLFALELRSESCRGRGRRATTNPRI